MYSISDLERISGIKAHTLRVWEKRYSLFNPDRTEGNHRMYTDDDVLTLMRIKRLLDKGYRISKAAKVGLQENEENKLVKSDSDLSEEGVAEEFLLITMNFDEARFVRLYEKLSSRFTFETIWNDYLLPGLHKTDQLWLSRKIVPAQEHFISCLIRKKIISELDKIPLAEESDTEFVLFLPPGEHHELGLLVSEYIVRRRGFKTYYLGPNVPIQNLDMFKSRQRGVIFVTFSQGMRMSAKFRKFISELDDSSAQLIINGEVLPDDREILKDVACLKLNGSFNGFVKLISSLHTKVLMK